MESGLQIGQALIGHQNYVYNLAVSSDGKWIVSGSGDHTVRVWDIENSACIHIENRNKSDKMRQFYLEGRNTYTDTEESKTRFMVEDNAIYICGKGPGRLLAAFESQISQFVVGDTRDTIVAGLDSGIVAMLKIVDCGKPSGLFL